MQKGGITQLDLLLLGRRGLTSRVSTVERSVRELALVKDNTAIDEGVPLRPNLLTNSSFEFYTRNATLPSDWPSVGGSPLLATGIIGADGSSALSCSGAAWVAQNVAAGQAQPASSGLLSVAARTLTAGSQVYLHLEHTPGVVAGLIYRLDPQGNIAQTDEVPPDGQWYRFWRGFILAGGGTAGAYVGSAAGGPIWLDAAKYEKEEGVTTFIEPSAYAGGDWGAAVNLRNLSAENIVAGTLTVGGAGSGNPRISVRDGANQEIVTIGAPLDGYYGINILGTAGLRVSGSGSVEVTGGGSVTVGGGGSVVVLGTGVIRAGTAGGQRVQLAADGLAAFNSSNQEQVRLEAATGRMRVFGSGAISVEGGGSFIAGTPGAARMEYTAAGLFAYSAANVEKVSISVADATVRVASDALIIDGELVLDDLQIDGELSVGQDLRVGTNVLFVDQSQSNVGINRAPDPQFDLDIAGNIRWGGWGVGKMALQLAGATAIMHYDGALKTLADYSGFLESHLGLPPSVGGSGNVFVPGKFGKALYANVAMSNLAGSDPSFELGVDGWSSSWGDTVASTTAAPLFGTRSLAITADGVTVGAGVRKDISVTPGTTYTLSAYVRAPAGRRMRARVWDGASFTTLLANGAYSPTNGQWTRVSVTFTPTQSTARCVFMDDEAGSLSGVYYVDAAQLEIGRAASPFTTTSRARTTLGYPGAGILSPSAGTLMAWANPEGVGPADTAFLLQHFVSGGNRLYVYYSGNALNWAVGDTFFVVPSSPVPTGWTHYALAWEEGIGYLYVNGVLVQSGAFTGLTATDGALRVGNDNQVNNGWRGRIDEVVVLDRAAPASEIRAVFESNAPVFAETSNWGFRTANTLAWADEEGLWATDGAGNAAFGVSGTSGKSWGGQTIDAGDVLLGNSSSYVWWDASENTVKMTGDFTAGNITGSTIRTGLSGARIILSPAEGVAVLASDSSYRVVLPTTGGINLHLSSDPNEAPRALNFVSGTTRRGLVSGYVDGGSVAHVGLTALNSSGNSVGTNVFVRSDQTFRVFTNFQEMFRVNAWPNGVWANGQLTVVGGPVEITGTGGYFNAGSSTGSYRVNGTQVVGPRVTGWGVPTGTISRAAFDSGTVTLAGLAQRFAALVLDLRGHGLINN